MRPRMLVNIKQVDTETTLLGHRVSTPICVAPTSAHSMAHRDGEKATAKGTSMYFRSHLC